MLTQEIKKKIDSARDILVGKVPDPKAQVEQITTALIYKFMDDMDKESMSLPKGKARFFTNGYEKYAWNKLMDPKVGGHERLNLYGEAITRMSQNPHLPQLFREIFKDAFLPYRDPETLNLFLKEINSFSYDDSENLGDAYEYLLSILGSQGDAGQFRTPRHIIDFIVGVVNPKNDESVLDPACGTAGFLISTYKHILKSHTEKPLTPDEKKRLMTNLVGYDISPDMVRISLVNMYLHGFPNPNIYEYDTLTNDERWDDRFDVIMANPPFMTPKGGIRPHKRFAVQANRSEVLFVDYIIEHLNIKGRAGLIVPEGIIFQSSNAYKQLRKKLLEDGLYAVVSLPGGIFNPYSGVKTCILFFDNDLAKQSKEILFVKVLNDGFDLGAQRRPIDKNDLTDAVNVLKAQHIAIHAGSKNTLIKEGGLFAWVVTKEKIVESKDFNLSGDKYRAKTVYSNKTCKFIELGDIFTEIKNGKNVNQEDSRGKYRVTRIQTISDGTINLEKTKWTNDKVTESDFLQDGDILLSHINSIDHLAKTAICRNLNGEKVVHGTNLIRLRADRNKLNPLFAIYIFKSKFFLNIARNLAQKAVNQASIRTSDLKEIKVPLPPLDVQKQIVAELEGYQKIIDGANQIVGNYKPIIKIDPGWKMVDLADLCNFIRGITYEKSDEASTETDKIVLRANNINLELNELDLSEIKYLRKDLVLDEKKKLKKNDIFICTASGSKEHLGKVAFILEDMPHYFGGFMGVLRVREKTLADFVFYNLVSDMFRDFIRRLTQGVNINNLKGADLLSFKIPLPPINKQKEIVAEIRMEKDGIRLVQKMIKLYDQKIKSKIAEVWGE